MKVHEILVFIPTYNERDNVEKLYHEIKRYKPDVDILFCDDNSPDGTGTLIDTLVKQDASVHVVHRSNKLGLGTAHKEAFDFAQQYKYRYLITMDADFTHHPCYIPVLLEKKEQADVVIGSRYIGGGSMHGWGKIRLPFTYFWRMMIKHGLGMPYDCTGAFRLYNVKQLKTELYKQVDSRGFSFCMESIFWMHHTGLKITEVPIKAQNRIHGKSKLSVGIMTEVAKIWFRLLLQRIRGLKKKRR